MTILTAKNTPRVTYTATSGQTAFTIPFEFFSTNDIKVYNGTTLLTYNASPSTTTQYSITGTASSSDSAYEFGAGGTITLGSTGASADDVITIIRDISIERTSDFPTTGSFDISSLNTDLDKIYAKLADIDQQSDRSVKLLDTDSISATVTLPAKASRQDKVLTFDSSGNAVTSIASVDVTTIAGISSDVTTVSGIASNVTSVAGISSNVTTVAGISSNVTTVAGISSDVTTVAGISSNVTTVAGKASLITSDFAANMSLVTSDFVSDMSLVTADFISDVNTLATTDIVNDLNLLATSDFVSDLNSLATTDFVSDLNALEAIKADVTTVAGSISDVNNFASIYRIGSSDPTTSLDGGDLFYNSTDNELKFYNGSAWASITAGIANIVEDTTPQLGGNLDAQTNNITNLGTVNTHTIPGGTGTFALTSDITFTASSTDTLTNKTINSASNTITITESNISDLGSYITASSTDTLSNKTISTSNNTISGLVTETGSTGSAEIPTGTTAQRDGSPATGMFRFNSTTSSFEGYNGSAWGSVGGGATGAGGDAIFQENEQTVTTSYTISTNKNAMSVGPITINSSVTVTIPSGSRWVIL